MSKYFIEEVKCEWDGGVGPCCGVCVVVASIKYRTVDGVRYLTIHQVEEELSFFQTEEEIFDTLLHFGDYEEDSDEFAEADWILNESNIDYFDDVNLDSGDEEFEKYIDDLDDGTNMTAKLLRYGLALITCEPEQLQDLIDAGTGKSIEDLKYNYEFDLDNL